LQRIGKGFADGPAIAPHPWSVHAVEQSLPSVCENAAPVAAGAAMLPLLGLLFRQIYLERLEARERANDKARILAQQTAQSLNQVLRDYEAVLQRIVQRPLVRALDARACDPLIAEFVRLYPGFTNLVVQDLKGGNDCSFLKARSRPNNWRWCLAMFRRALPRA
jgi:hypothetical protein